MPSDYEVIRAEHLPRYGWDLGNFGDLFVDLYADRTHFLLELLQNAQDARATRVRFDLHPDRLEVRHDGRDFTEADVIGICGIKRSTKVDDPEQIGRFGVGFKSVYAYTTRPTVHCGDEHFQVKDYVLPYPVNPVVPGAGWSTLQILPFDRSDSTPEAAVDQISGRLRRLNGRTILFLRDLKELEWSTPDGHSGHILRETRTDRTARRVSLLAGADAESTEEEWLVFDRPVHLADGVHPGTVEIAFALTRDDRGAELITSAKGTELVAFFPTRRETHVGFLIQGPFVPVPSRENVRDDHPLNQRLAAEAAELTVEALEAIKAMGLLTVGALETLPLEPVSFPPGDLLRPLYDGVRDALTNRSLLPTADGRHLAAAQVRLARGTGLRELFSPEQLGELLESDDEVAWLVAGISADRTHALHRYLVGYREFRRWRSEEDMPTLVPELDPDAVVRRIDPSFLARRSTDWIVSFYRWLAPQAALRDTLRTKPMIRCGDGQHVAAFVDDEPQVWLPPDGETAYRVVDGTVAVDPDALEFLCSLGLTEPDAADEVMTAILPRYDGDEKPGRDEHAANLERIAAALRSAAGAKLAALRDKLRNTPFLLAYDLAQREEYWCSPPETYEPSERLTEFMEGNEDALFLTEESLRHIDLWRNLGVDSDIVIKKRDPDWHGYVTVRNQRGWHQRGLLRFDPDLAIIGLEYALEHPTLARSVLVWSLLSSLDRPIRGFVERSTRQEFSDSSTYEVNSPVADLLVSHDWLLDREGNWRKPDEITLDDLDPAYPRSEDLARQLEMRPTVSRDVADFLNIDSDDVERLRRQPELIQRVLAAVREEERGTAADAGDDDQSHDDDSDDEPIDVAEGMFEAFNRDGAADVEEFDGDGAAANPARRQERAAEALSQAKDAESLQRDRFKLLSRKVWEAKDPAVRAYLLQTYGGRCQICQATFPRRDGQPFFDARYIVSRVERRWLDTPGNSICLCPTCLAKTLHGSSKAVDILHDLRQLTEDAPDLPDGGNVNIELCGEQVSIGFAQRHLIDLGALFTAQSVEPQ
jgi:hypothetical protein